MQNKIFFSLALMSSLLYSQEFKNEKFELLSKTVNLQEKTIVAKGDVVIFSASSYIRADKAIYDKNRDTLELFGNVLIIKNNNLQTKTDYAFLNLKDEKAVVKPNFIFENKSNFWIKSNIAEKNSDKIKLKDTVLSSCECEDPDWSIKVSSASYNTKTKWLSAYNPRFYIKDTPILYLPYIGFSTNKQRKTGLLTPTIGYSNSEGLFYAQPIYFAPAKNYDIELIPQFRNQRGVGVYGYLRYVDSPYSILRLKTGLFRDKKSYQEEQNLENQKHYGWGLEYTRNKLFSTNQAQDGLYASFTYLNDVDFLTLETNDNISIDKKVESKLNYFYNTSNFYTGLYAKYYIDTSKKSNSNTLQELPHLQFHKYNKRLSYLDSILYSLDANFKNYTRKEGLGAKIYDISLPLSYNNYIFNDYLYFNLENKTVLSKIHYTNSDSSTNKDYKNASLLQNETKISLGSDLIKPYDKYLHTVNLKAEHIYPKNLVKDGDIYNVTTLNSKSKQEELSSFPIEINNKKTVVSVNQSLYNKDNLKQFVNHKISQSVLYDSGKAKLHDLENYIRVNHDYGYVSNRLTYNIEDDSLTQNDTSLRLKYNNFTFDAGYYKSKNTEHSYRNDLESYRLKATYQFSKEYRLSYYRNYNIKESIINKEGIGLNIDDRCWNLDLNFEQEIEPISTNVLNSKKEQKIIFLNLKIKPIGGVKQKYKFDEKVKN